MANFETEVYKLLKLFDWRVQAINMMKRSAIAFGLPKWSKLTIRAFHKLLGNFLAASRISSNFLHSEQFL